MAEEAREALLEYVRALHTVRQVEKVLLEMEREERMILLVMCLAEYGERGNAARHLAKKLMLSRTSLYGIFRRAAEKLARVASAPEDLTI